jgi:hypothetical protein
MGVDADLEDEEEEEDARLAVSDTGASAAGIIIFKSSMT